MFESRLKFFEFGLSMGYFRSPRNQILKVKTITINDKDIIKICLKNTKFEMNEIKIANQNYMN